jgi:hypothetical protein
MYQTDRGTYRTNQNMFKQFRQSCLGKIAIAMGIVVVLLIIAAISNPSYKKMKDGMEDNIKQSIWSRDSITADGMDIFMSNIGHTFSRFNDSVTTDMQRRWEMFISYADSTGKPGNGLGYKSHLFWSTFNLRDNLRSEEVCAGIGIFGMVIPLVDFNKFLPREGPVIDYDNKPLIEHQGTDDEYYGETPVDIFRYEGE